MGNNSNGEISIIYYVLFGVESLALSLIIIYLILSKFNNKTLKGTFESKDKVLIYVLSTIIMTAISTLEMNMTSSNYTGIINKDNTAKSINLVLDKASTISLSGDSYVTSFTNADATNSNIKFNGYKLYVNGNSIN